MGSLNPLFPLMCSGHELPSKSNHTGRLHRGSQIEHELQLPRGLVKSQLAGIHSQSFGVGRSGVGSRNTHF